MNIIPNPKKIIENDGICQNANNVKFINDGEISKEGYKLLIEKNGITVKASTENGEFYANKTLEQLKFFGDLKCGEINDSPKFEYRGFMLDVSRHFVSISFIKHYIDIISKFKFNVFHWHLSDDHGFRIDLDCYPLLKNCNVEENKVVLEEKYIDESYRRGYYTKEEVRDVIEYAKERFVDVVPEIDMPGHLSAVLHEYNDLSCSGEKYDIVTGSGIFLGIGCIANEDFIKFSFDVVKEIASLFDSKYIHIGGDEVPTTNWENCPKCQALMKAKGMKKETELQTYFENLLIEYIKSLGKVAVCWNDFVNDDTDIDAVSHYWTFHYKTADLDGVALHKEMQKQLNKGRKHIMSDHSYCYVNMPYEYISMGEIYGYDPTTMSNITEVTAEGKLNILGAQCNMWTEFAFDRARLDYQIFPRLFAFAEVVWGTNNDFYRFKNSLIKMKDFIKNNGIDQGDISMFEDYYSQEEKIAGIDEFYILDEKKKGMLSYKRYLKKIKEKNMEEEK